MGKQEDYQKKLEVIRAIKDSQIKKPHHIPVGIYIQESVNLYMCALDDKEPLITGGLDPELLEDLPTRFGALKAAQSKWVTFVPGKIFII